MMENLGSSVLWDSHRNTKNQCCHPSVLYNKKNTNLSLYMQPTLNAKKDFDFQ